MKTVHTLCYWIVGYNNPAQPMAVAIDHHDCNGELITETYTAELIARDPEAARKEAWDYVSGYARPFAIPVDRINFDPDSTNAFADC